MIFEMNPKNFIKSLEKYKESGKFLLAGACVDFLWNGAKEKAEELIKFCDLYHT